MKKISLEQLLGESGEDNYREQYQYVCGLIEKQQILPVKSSPLNGKKPALHQSYWLAEAALDYEELIEELKFCIMPAIRTDYYLNHLETYREERKWVRLLNRYLSEQGAKGVSTECVSLNERSFQIWGREKFLQREQGRKILAHCGVGMEELCVYNTAEPLAYYSACRRIPQTVLILENKDTFYSMRRHLMDCLYEGRKLQIFGVETGTLVYGAGKGILRSYEDFGFCVEPHINASQNEMLYFGDLDYEGIGIYERLAALFENGGMEEGGCGEGHKVKPLIRAYEKMLEKAKVCGADFLPETSEKQNRNLSGAFFSYFSRQAVDEMNCILEAGKYIPQEIVNRTDF